jgi:transcriptional regulator GlxA family with amidase domain
MTVTTRVLFALFDGFEFLDLAGPSSVFQTANYLSGEPLYKSIPISPDTNLVRCASGFTIESQCSYELQIQKTDFFIVVGAERDPLLKVADHTAYINWLTETAKQCGRIGSVCSGAYLLAKTGLADGHTISSHWGACKELDEHFPNVKVNTENIYTHDRNIWTSAGVAAGIDMALAIVEKDHGPTLSSKIAKRLVVYSRRQGTQTQFSSFLEAQTAAVSRDIQAAVEWMIKNADKDISVATLADKARMSERTFYRKFHQTMSMPPAKYLELLRLDMAKQLLESGLAPKEVAAHAGFRSYSGFRVAFIRAFGLSPSAHRRLHRGTGDFPSYKRHNSL